MQRHKGTESKPCFFYAMNTMRPVELLQNAVNQSAVFYFLKLTHLKRRRGDGTCKSK